MDRHLKLLFSNGGRKRETRTGRMLTRLALADDERLMATLARVLAVTSLASPRTGAKGDGDAAGHGTREPMQI